MGILVMLESIVLLPGLLCTEDLWVDVTPSLADIACPYTVDLSAATSIASMASDLLERAPPSFSLIGFSMGSQVALEVYARAPHRVNRLALMSTNAYGLTPNVRAHLKAAMERIAISGLDPYLADAFPLYFSEKARALPVMRERFVGMATQLGAAVALRQMEALLSYDGFSFPLSIIRCPTTFICGGSDARTPPSLHYDMARDIPSASVSVIPSSGHFTMLQAPEVVVRLVREWLARSNA
jgi:pimeloyl-ACP methyl ester carboxylesterase